MLIDRRVALILFTIAVLLYLPGIWWGLPYATAPDRIKPWGSDELASLGAVAELYSVATRSPTFNPQYPLFHYVMQALFVGPYVLLLMATGQLSHLSVAYPYGLSDPVSALAVMTLLARLVSVFMAAGTVVVAYFTGTVLWEKRTGVIAAILVLLSYSMFYYSRTSNVDMGGLFWTNLGLLVFARCLQDTLTPQRAVWLGIFAALAVATKDASYAVFLVIGSVLVPRHLYHQYHAGANWREVLKPLWLGLATAAAVYLVASGLVFHPARFMGHVEWVANSTAAYSYPATAQGYFNFLSEILGHVAATIGTPAAVFVLIGLAVAWRHTPHLLWFALPSLGILVGTILPIHFVNFRYVMVMAYVLVFFAAYGLSSMFNAQWGVIQRVAPAILVIVCGWSLVRGIDLTYQMLFDSRYQLGAWFQKYAKPGDTVGYYGAPIKLPPLAPGISSVPLESWCTATDWQALDAPEFVVVIPQEHFDLVHEWSLSPRIYQGLQDGTLGYQRVVWSQTLTLFSKRPVPFVNPPVQVFMKEDYLSQMSAGQPELSQPQPLLVNVEKKLGLTAQRPAGLVRDYTRAGKLCPDPPEQAHQQ